MVGGEDPSLMTLNTDNRDHFGGHARDYLRYRPAYPESFFQQLMGLVPHRKRAWDCGTGNGQVAQRLAQAFELVTASDLSQDQLDHAITHPNIEYKLWEAHQTDLPDSSVGLITVASAVHWFEQERFYEEAYRVLSPGGILAIWTYAPDLVSPNPLAQIVRAFAQSYLKNDWPTGIEWVFAQYAGLPIPNPFEEVSLPPTSFPVQWSFERFMGWISTWSGVRRHAQRTGVDPCPGIKQQLYHAWPQTGGEEALLELPFYYQVKRKAG